MARLFKSKFRVESDEVQGPGSWVEFQRPTWGVTASVTYIKELLEACISDWNWTDDNGDPIPLPTIEPGIVERIPQVEANWLMQNSGIIQREEAKKN
jgi:hypothetical protein